MVLNVYSSCRDSEKKTRCERMVLLGLTLARHICGSHVPPHVVHCLQADAATVALARQVARRLSASDGDAPSQGRLNTHVPSGFRLSRFRIRARERVRDKVAQVVRTIATPRIEHVQLIALPTSLHFLYVFIKLGADYCVRPVWRRVSWLRRGQACDAENTGC